MKDNKPEIIKFTAIGHVISTHTDPRTVPIQPRYADNVHGRIEILPEYVHGLKDLDGFSHIIVLYQFHHGSSSKLVVKPFLQDVERGIFSTRAPCRPNRIGLSIVELIRIDGGTLHISGVDMLDGTPVLDIKPYVDRFDNIVTTRNGWHDEVDEETAGIRGRRPDRDLSG